MWRNTSTPAGPAEFSLLRDRLCWCRCSVQVVWLWAVWGRTWCYRRMPHCNVCGAYWAWLLPFCSACTWAGFLPADGKVSDSCCSSGREHPLGCVSAGFGAQVAATRFLRSSPLQQSRLSTQLKLPSRTQRGKGKSKFLFSGYLIVVTFSFLEVIRAGLCSTATELASFHSP